MANLLLLGRVIRPNKARIDIVSVLRKVLDTKSDWFRASGMGLSATFGRHRIMVEGDEHQLEQVFVNLITNAQQAMSEGSVGETLAVEVGLVDDKAHLSFSDNGPGIESQDLPRIFDPFFSTREVGKGSGLGLSTCYQVISQHGGSIRAESVAGQGATITIELPVAEGPPYEATQQGFEAADAPSAGMGVLVVDDEQMVAEVIERTLSRQGYLVDIATGGSEVVSRTDLDSYDLILLDMKMPGLGGEELYEHMRRLPREVASRVVFVTGDTANITTQEFIERTGNPVLAKPFTIDELTEVARRFAAKAKSG